MSFFHNFLENHSKSPPSSSSPISVWFPESTDDDILIIHRLVPHCGDGMSSRLQNFHSTLPFHGHSGQNRILYLVEYVVKLKEGKGDDPMIILSGTSTYLSFLWFWLTRQWGGLSRIPKRAFLSWAAARDRLGTRDKHISWGLHIPSVCVLCNEGGGGMKRSSIFSLIALTATMYGAISHLGFICLLLLILKKFWDGWCFLQETQMLQPL